MLIEKEKGDQLAEKKRAFILLPLLLLTPSSSITISSAVSAFNQHRF